METNILIKIQEDPSKNVISIVLTNQLWTDGRTTDDGPSPITKAHLVTA